MFNVPQRVRSVLQQWSREFSPTVWARFQVLAFAAILCQGRHTVCRLLQFAGELAVGNWSSYHRVLSHRQWSSWNLARILAEAVLNHLVTGDMVYLLGDDTVTEHPGRKVHGKAKHRDAVRSSHSYTAWRWGHKWVVLAIRVHLPGIQRAWALPILCALYRSCDDNKRLGRRHRTPNDLMQGLLCKMLRWFPEKKFTFCGDGAFSSHAMAWMAVRHPRLTVVSKFHPKASLYDLPKRKAKGRGRPPVRGDKRPSPIEVVSATKKRTRMEVAWYGGGRRQVEIVTRTGHWYRSGQGLIPVRWVYVEDRTGTHRSEYFFTTDIDQSPREIVEIYASRWAIEVTFAEVRQYLGVETTRGRCAKTILRAEPCLLCLYTLIVLWFSELPKSEKAQPVVQWIGTQKTSLTFSDAIVLVRRHLWRIWISETPRYAQAFQKISVTERNTIIHIICLTL